MIPYAGIICRYHGNVDIDYENYKIQMSNANDRWRCPKCNAVSEFDDARFEEINFQE